MVVRRVAACRRSSLLTGFVGLWLILLASLGSTASRDVAVGTSDAIVSAVGQVADVARTAPELIPAAQRSGLDRQAPQSAVPASVLLAMLLAVRRRRDSVIGAARQPLVFRAVGRGPPVNS